MMTRKLVFLSLFASLTLITLLCLSPAYAEVKVESEFEGTLVITSPEGDITLVESGEAVPPVATGSILEVFDGQFTVATSPGETVKVVHLEHEITVSDGATVNLVGAESTGVVRVLSGSVELINNLGQKVMLQVGQEYPIQLIKAAPGLPATAAGEPTGFGAADDAPPADSASIEDSRAASVSPTT